MKYEFNTDVVKKLPLDALMAEKALLFELHEYVNNLCLKKEDEMLTSIENTTKKRKATKTENGWVSKNVGQRRLL